MPAKRNNNPVDLLQWERDGLNTEEMRQRLAEDGKQVSIELVRLRLREAAPGVGRGPEPSQRLNGSPAQPHDGNSRLRPRSMCWRNFGTTCRT